MKAAIIAALMFFALQCGAQEVLPKSIKADFLPSGSIPVQLFIVPDSGVFVGARGDDGWMVWELVPTFHESGGATQRRFINHFEGSMQMPRAYATTRQR